MISRSSKSSAPTKVKAAARKLKERAVSTKKEAKVKAKTITERRQPLGHLLIEKKLRESGFKGTVSSSKDTLDKYSMDESIFSIRPQLVIEPRTQADVEAAVKMVAGETKRFPSLSLTPRAAGTGLGGGSLTDSIVIDTSRYLNNIGQIDTKKGVTYITCEPGAMWRDVERVLLRHGLYLPSYPASKDICTIGGAVANNAAGPDSLRYGNTAEWVSSLNVTLFDGNTYTIKPLTYKELKSLIKKPHAYAHIAQEVFKIIEENEEVIKKAKPSVKNTAGYAIWDVLSTSVSSFKRGHGTFDLTRLFSGSQGTIGIITSITLRTEPIAKDTDLVVIPIFDLLDAAPIINDVLAFDPINIELFDGLTYDLALRNPQFFKSRLSMLTYYKVMLSMYTTYHVRFNRRIPEFFILVTLPASTKRLETERILTKFKNGKAKHARRISSPIEREMYWQIRRASYSLSKLQDPQKRPAAFLEDVAVPPEQLSKFFAAIKNILKKYNVQATVHGHGGDGHLHFYPLLDFTQKTTPTLITKMAAEFFETAVKLGGSLCGEHNDGIIRTPHLCKMFSKPTIALFREIEHACDPDDIFNPGKKVNPRFDIKSSIRNKN